MTKVHQNRFNYIIILVLQNDTTNFFELPPQIESHSCFLILCIIDHETIIIEIIMAMLLALVWCIFLICHNWPK